MPVEKIKRDAASGEETKKEEPTLKEIIADKELSRDFNKWMEAQGKEDVMVKLVKGEVEKGDLAVLSGEREKFLERKSQEKVMEKVLLAEENLKGFVHGSPELESISELVGVEGVKDALTSVMREKAMANESDTTHEDFFADYLLWVEASDEYDKQKKGLSDFLESIRLNEAEARSLVAVADENERRQIIEEIWQERGVAKTGSSGKWFWKKPAWSAEQQELINKTAEELSYELKNDGNRTRWSWINQELNEVQKKTAESKTQLTESLTVVLSENGSREIGRLLTAETSPKEKAMSFEEMKRSAKEAQKPDATEKQFFEYADDEFADFVVAGKYDLDDSYQKEIALDNFMTHYREGLVSKAEKEGGLWAAIYRAIIEPFLEEFLSELKKQTQVDKDKKKLIMKKKKK